MYVSHHNVTNNLPSQARTRLVGHEGPIKAVTFSHDGKYCITAGYDRTVRLWNPTRIDPCFNQNIASTLSSSSMNNLLTTPIDSIPHALPIQSYMDGHTHPISSIDIDDTSTTLLSASNKAMIVTDVITKKLQRRFQGHAGVINTVACSSGGSVFASGSYDGTVRIMDGRSFSNTPIQILSDAKDSITCVKILEKDNDIAEICSVSVDGSIRTYDIRKGCLHVESFGEDVALTSVAFTSDLLCSVVSSLNGAIYVLEKESGTHINTCYGGHKAGRYSLDVGITADDQHIVSGSEDGSAVIYDFVTGKVVQNLKGHKKASAVAVHPVRDHSSIVITGSYDGNAVVWSNGNEIFQTS